MKKILLAFILFCIFMTPVRAAETDYPPLTGQVVDEAGVLTPQQKSQLLQLLAADKNNQVAVAVVKDLRGRNGREYGIELARRWQLGQKGKDNGVLILLSPKDRYAGIEVGYGLEDILPDSLTGRILRQEVFPPLQRNLDYGTALLNGTKAVMTVLAGGEPGLANEEASPLEDAASTLLTLLMIYLILSGRGRFLGGGRSFFRRGGGGGGFRGGGGSFGGGGAVGRF